MMYLNSDEQFVKEFFTRTKTVILQYSEIPNQQDEKYDVTLFCNCLIGLFVFPEQKYFSRINDNLLSEENCKLLKNSIHVQDEETYNVRKIFSRMRNAVAHGHVRFPKSNIKNDREIHSVIFYDDSDPKKQKSQANVDLRNFEFQLEINIMDLKKIIEEFCNNIFKGEVQK